MRLTNGGGESFSHAPPGAWLSRRCALVIIVFTLPLIFQLDRATGTAPVQHLYYLPIILAALKFGKRGGLAAALAAIVLNHSGKDAPFSFQYAEADIIQITLFIAVGIITAKLTNDAGRLRRLALTDDLTGLHNLRSFEARLVNLVRKSRETNATLALLVLDLDRLKPLNDKHGHLAGAEAVRTVGRFIAAHLPPDAVACRYGGDEFVIAIPRCTPSRAREIADGLCLAVRAASPVLAGHRFPAATLSISIGIANHAFTHSADDAYAGDEEIGEQMFRRADQALYVAKARGRNRVVSAA